MAYIHTSTHALVQPVVLSYLFPNTELRESLISTPMTKRDKEDLEEKVGKMKVAKYIIQAIEEKLKRDH